MLNKFILILFILTSLQAQGTNTKYLYCTLVENNYDGDIEYISQRIAKARDAYNLKVQIGETELIFTTKGEQEKYKYKYTTQNGYDVYNKGNIETIYYKDGYRLLIEKSGFKLGNIELKNSSKFYKCQPRTATAIEKTKSLANKYLPSFFK